MTLAARISVLVLVDRQADSLADLHREVLAQLEKLGLPCEFLYLIGASNRSVADAVLALRDQDPERVRVLRFEGAVGDAARLAAGFERARGELIFTVPCQFETDLSVLGELYSTVQEGADVAFASRNVSGVGAARWQSRLFNRLVSTLTATPFSDVASRVRAIRREVAQEVPLYGDFHRYLPVLAHNAGFNVREVPARRDPRGTATIVHAPRIYLWRAMDLLSVFFLSRFTRRPLRLFGSVGSAFVAVGAVILLVIGVQRLLGTPLADRPILVLGTLLLGLGVQAFTIGLLGELLLFFHARNVRDYRIARVYESETQALPPRRDP